MRSGAALHPQQLVVELRRANRLGELGGDAGGLCVGGVDGSADHDQTSRPQRRHGLDPLGELEAPHAGQLGVEQGRLVRTTGLGGTSQQPQGRTAVPRAVRADAPGSEAVLQHLPVIGDIVDDQHARAGEV